MFRLEERKKLLFRQNQNNFHLETVVQGEVRKRKNIYCEITLLCGIQKNGTNGLIYKAEIETQV